MLRLGALPLRCLREATPKQWAPLPTSASNSASQRHFTTSEPREIKRRGALIHPKPQLRKKKRYIDPQHKRVAEARERKNVARQAVLQEQRVLARGDPARGTSEPTGFVKSFDTAMDPEDEAAIVASGGVEPPTVDSDPQSIIAETSELSPTPHSEKRAPKPKFLNAFVTPETLQRALDRSRLLVQHPKETRTGAVDRSEEARIEGIQVQEHSVASEAINRIVAVQGANAKARKHINIRRCVEEFGRHNTDMRFAAQSSGASEIDGVAENASAAKDLERVGPDTGSSEVQIAILTAKIRRLADEQEGKATQDKVNKRNLRLLVHRRQRLLKYFMKKSRGGPRWQHLIETLGLTPATWQGEISL